MKKIIIAIGCIIFLSCGREVTESKGEISKLNKQIESQSKRLEQLQDEIETLHDSISNLQNSLDRCHTHSRHATVDVKEAKNWANANGYGKTLGPYIDNVLYDLEAISQYSLPQ